MAYEERGKEVHALPEFGSLANEELELASSEKYACYQVHDIANGA